MAWSAALCPGRRQLRLIVIEAGADRHGRRLPVRHIQEKVRLCWPADPRSNGAAGLGDILGQAVPVAVPCPALSRG